MVYKYIDTIRGGQYGSVLCLVFYLRKDIYLLDDKKTTMYYTLRFIVFRKCT